SSCVRDGSTDRSLLHSFPTRRSSDLRARGARRVFLVDINAERLAMAATLVRPDEAIRGDENDVTEMVLKLTGGRGADVVITAARSEEHTSELQSREKLVSRLLLEKKK